MSPDSRPLRGPKSVLFAADGTSELWDLLTTPVGFDLQHVRGFDDSVSAVRKRHYDGIIATLPLGSDPFQEFIDAVRADDSPCRTSGLVVLTTSDRVDEAKTYLGSGVNRVVSIDDATALRQAIVGVTNVGLRAPIRVMAQLTIAVGERDCHIRTFTKNVSRSGMLLDTSNKLDVGQTFAFSFRSPVDDRRISGRAEVVRHARSDREQTNGIGVQFVSLDDGATKALDSLFKKED